MRNIRARQSHGLAFHHGSEGACHIARRRRDAHAGGLERLDLLGGSPLAPRDDGPGVAHAFSLGRRGARDEGGHRLVHLLPDELRCPLLRTAADLTDKDDAVGVLVGLEELEGVDEIHAAHRIAADSDAGGLPDPQRRELPYGLVGERARARDHADVAGLVDVAGHDADLAGVGRDDARTVGPDESRLALQSLEHAPHLEHVDDGDPLGDTDHEGDARVERLENGVRGSGRWNEDAARVGTCRLYGLSHGIEDGDLALELLPAATRGDAGHHLRAILEHLFGVKPARASGDALYQETRVLPNEDAHVAPPTAATTLRAPSAMVPAAWIASPLSLRIFRPSSTLVPSRRTTSGTFKPSSFAAATTPLAMTSHFMMPPKMLTKMARTLGLFKIILKALVTCSWLAPPPTSRKFAGATPWPSPKCLMMSMVAMASPAPFTRQPTFPSSAT